MLHWCRKLRWSLYQCFSTLTTVREKEPQRRLRWKEEQLSSNIQTKIISCFCFVRNVSEMFSVNGADGGQRSRRSPSRVSHKSGSWQAGGRFIPLSTSGTGRMFKPPCVHYGTACSQLLLGHIRHKNIWPYRYTLHIMYHLYIFEIYCSIPFLFLSLSLSYLFIALPQATKLLLLL